MLSILNDDHQSQLTWQFTEVSKFITKEASWNLPHTWTITDIDSFSTKINKMSKKSSQVHCFQDWRIWWWKNCLLESTCPKKERMATKKQNSLIIPYTMFGWEVMRGMERNCGEENKVPLMIQTQRKSWPLIPSPFSSKNSFGFST